MEKRFISICSKTRKSSATTRTARGRTALLLPSTIIVLTTNRLSSPNKTGPVLHLLDGWWMLVARQESPKRRTYTSKVKTRPSGSSPNRPTMYISRNDLMTQLRKVRYKSTAQTMSKEAKSSSEPNLQCPENPSFSATHWPNS